MSTRSNQFEEQVSIICVVFSSHVTQGGLFLPSRSQKRGRRECPSWGTSLNPEIKWLFCFIYFSRTVIIKMWSSALQNTPIPKYGANHPPPAASSASSMENAFEEFLSIWQCQTISVPCDAMNLWWWPMATCPIHRYTSLACISRAPYRTHLLGSAFWCIWNNEIRNN